MIKRALAVSLSSALLAVPALAGEPAAPAAAADPVPTVSGVTVTPKAGTIDPQLKCADEACVKTVLKLLKTRYPREYQNLMRWCMANDSQRMAVMSSGLIGSGGQVDNLNQSLTPGDSGATGASSTEQLICDDRFSKQ
jgi:hypothetical protein